MLTAPRCCSASASLVGRKVLWPPTLTPLRKTTSATRFPSTPSSAPANPRQVGASRPRAAAWERIVADLEAHFCRSMRPQATRTTTQAAGLMLPLRRNRLPGSGRVRRNLRAS
jgi:hypothetical protein